MQLIDSIGSTMGFKDKIKSLFLFSIRNKFTPTFLSIAAGGLFNYYNNQKDQSYIDKIQGFTDSLKAESQGFRIRETHLMEREKSFLAIYESHCKQYEEVMKRDCATGKSKNDLH